MRMWERKILSLKKKSVPKMDYLELKCLRTILPEVCDCKKILLNDK